jgi:hypothetical protein
MQEASPIPRATLWRTHHNPVLRPALRAPHTDRHTDAHTARCATRASRPCSCARCSSCPAPCRCCAASRRRTAGATGKWGGMGSSSSSQTLSCRCAFALARARVLGCARVLGWACAGHLDCCCAGMRWHAAPCGRRTMPGREQPRAATGVRSLLIVCACRGVLAPLQCKRTATFLPEVAGDQGWSQRQCIESLIRKAGARACVDLCGPVCARAASRSCAWRATCPVAAAGPAAESLCRCGASNTR